MRTISTSHNTILAGAGLLRLVSSDDGLVAAKVSRIRTAVTDLRPASADGFDVVTVKFAKMTTRPDDLEEGAEFTPKPVVRMVEDERTPKAKPDDPPKMVEATYNLSGTKAYELADDTDEGRKAFDKATEAYLNAKVEISVPELTAADMTKIVVAGPGGQRMPIPPNIADVLADFGPEL